ncbi:hypothetical protein B7463_g2654, partial [Scytalidium lignicola]
MSSLTASTQANPTALESLPVEIQTHILRSLQDIKTLGTLLRASPRFLQVYQGTREETISNIVCNQITPAILPLAVNVLQQSYLRSHRRSRSKVLAFLETFKQSPPTLSQNRFSLETSKTLLKTHTVVEHFVNTFVIDRLNRLSKYVPHITPLLAESKALLGISGIEHHRLSRAFYHLELYGILFYDPENADDVITVEEQSSLFLAKLPDWELEELLCVREYLLDGLSNYLDQVEEDFLQEYINQGPPADIATNRFDMRFNFDDEYWCFFSTDGQDAGIQYRWMEGSLTRGLNALQDIFQSHTVDEREDALGNLAIDRPRNTMIQALDALTGLQYQTKVPACEIEDSVASRNILESPNDAWSWAMKKWAHLRKGGLASRGSGYDTLRRWGYVIWSNETLRTLGLLEKERSTDSTYKRKVLVIHCYRAADLDGRLGNKERRQGRAVETRTQAQYDSWRKKALKVAPFNKSH